MIYNIDVDGIIDTEREEKSFVLRNWLTQLCEGSASLESAGQVSRLEIQVEVDASVLRQNLFFFTKPQFLLEGRQLIG